MKNLIKILGIFATLSATFCVYASSNQQFGTIVGGITGGIIGNNLGHGSSRAVATIGGAVLGSVVGNEMGRNDDSDAYPRIKHFPHTEWQKETYSTPHAYPIRYRHTFIGEDGRLCRRSTLTNDYGDTIHAIYCCYQMSKDGYCTRWVRIKTF